MTLTPPDAPERHSDIVYPAALPFVLVHLSCLAVLWTGVTWRAAALGVALYLLRMFAIGAGYHRYFSHRAFSTGRVFQFMLGVLAQTSAQSSVLWWASRHRHHHLHSDTQDDTHSALRRGFWYSHVAWIFDRRHRKVDLDRIDDLARYPELRWLHRNEFLPAGAMALGGTVRPNAPSGQIDAVTASWDRPDGLSWCRRSCPAETERWLLPPRWRRAEAEPASVHLR